jgi:hypothetical protein
MIGLTTLNFGIDLCKQIGGKSLNSKSENVGVEYG